MAAISADEIIALLDLKPLPVEGGYYSETYREATILPPDVRSGAVGNERFLSTAIYYLLTPDTFSALHRLPGAEVYHFYLGDPVDLLILETDGGVETVGLGLDLASGLRPQAVVPGGCWQGSCLRPGGAFALMGTTMSPGFHQYDFELGERDDLLAAYPAAAAQIRALTR